MFGTETTVLLRAALDATCKSVLHRAIGTRPARMHRFSTALLALSMLNAFERLSCRRGACWAAEHWVLKAGTTRALIVPLETFGGCFGRGACRNFICGKIWGILNHWL
ncbi:hypothetical protein [Bradyrhizobium monzae]|uniref:hypothetical protein n=1 Tax=Bradyrhizobium sp. Oc8 TaxID=2876780 RepID=UPI001F448E0C|nr:hypothetical protein [Bradyrhizobium sp. Oc8]